jgi:hypothetical protein
MQPVEPRRVASEPAAYNYHAGKVGTNMAVEGKDYSIRAWQVKTCIVSGTLPGSFHLAASMHPFYIVHYQDIQACIYILGKLALGHIFV